MNPSTNHATTSAMSPAATGGSPMLSVTCTATARCGEHEHLHERDRADRHHGADEHLAGTQDGETGCGITVAHGLPNGVRAVAGHELDGELGCLPCRVQRRYHRGGGPSGGGERVRRSSSPCGSAL